MHDTSPTTRPEKKETAPLTVAELRACTKSVVVDWYDNSRVDRLYPLACYTAAVDSISLDSSYAREDIQRALDYARDGKIAPVPPESRASLRSRTV